MRVYQGIILFLDENGKEKNLIEQGLYKVYLLPPHSKIVNGIPLSYFGTHSTNFYRYSNVIYRPGDRVYLLQLEDENSNYYLILGSPGNIFAPEYTANRVTIYDSILGNGIILSEPELTSLNLTSGSLIKTDTIQSLISDLYLTLSPEKEEIDIKNIDLINGNIPTISALSQLEDENILKAFSEFVKEDKTDSVSYKAIAPKNLFKTHLIQSNIFLRPESRLLQFPYDYYRIGKNIQKDKDAKHLLHLFDLPHYKIDLSFINNKGLNSNNTIIYSNNQNKENVTDIDSKTISLKYKDSLKVINNEDIISDNESINFISNKRKINFGDNLNINSPNITDSKITKFKNDSYLYKALIRHDTLNSAKEYYNSIEITNNNLEFKQRSSDISINNNKITEILDTTIIYQTPKNLTLKYDKYNKTSFTEIKEDNILLKVQNGNNNTGIHINKDFISLFTKLSKTNGITVDNNSITIDFNNKSTLVINESGFEFKVNGVVMLSLNSNGLLVNGDILTPKNISCLTLVAGSGAGVIGNGGKISGGLTVSGSLLCDTIHATTISANSFLGPLPTSGHSGATGSTIQPPNVDVPQNNATPSTNHINSAQNQAATENITQRTKTHNIQQPNVKDKQKANIKDGVNKIIENLKNSLNNPLNALKEFSCLLLKLVGLLTIGLICLLAFLLELLINMLDKLLGLILKVIKAVIKKIFEKLKQLLKPLFKKLKKFLKWLSEKLKALIETLKNFFELLADIFETLLDIISDILEPILEFLDKLLGFVVGCILDGVDTACSLTDLNLGLTVTELDTINQINTERYKLNNQPKQDIINYRNDLTRENNNLRDKINKKLNTVIDNINDNSKNIGGNNITNINTTIIGNNIDNNSNNNIDLVDSIEQLLDNVLADIEKDFENYSDIFVEKTMEIIAAKDPELYNSIQSVDNTLISTTLNYFDNILDTIINNNLDNIINDIVQSIEYC